MIMEETPESTLTVACWAGLANRLRVLVSGLALAEASGRRFTMLWPRTRDCAASYDELFANPWPVQDATLETVKDLPPYLGLYCPPLPDVLALPARHIAFLTPHWLTNPGRYFRHRALDRQGQQLFNSLQPLPAIAQRIAEFRKARFRPQMIGVHLRRGDFLFVRPETANNTASSICQVNKLLERWPEAGILLCSDDGAPHPGRDSAINTGIHRKFKQRFGERVVWNAPRSLDRTRLEAAQDAVVDLWLLRCTDAFIGTPRSSFSELAIYGRQVPYAWAGPDARSYKAIEFAWRMSGIAWLMRRDGRRRFGRNLSLPNYLRYYRGRMRGRLPVTNASSWRLHKLEQP